jgi:hypothetical protein
MKNVGPSETSEKQVCDVGRFAEGFGKRFVSSRRAAILFRADTFRLSDYTSRDQALRRFSHMWNHNVAVTAPIISCSIFAAVQESLGLKLEATRGPMPVLVIDRAEKPSQN